MRRLQVEYLAPPTLWEFQQSDDDVRGVVGPVGSGKSSVCNLEMPIRSAKQAPGKDGIRRTRWAVIRNTYGQLRDTTQKTFNHWVPSSLGYWHKESFTFHMRWKGVESEVLFRALDRPDDIDKLLSLELTGAYINEAREIPQEVFDQLQGRVGRFPAMSDGGPTWSGIWLDSNPWHTGHYLGELFSQGLPGFRLFRQPGGREPGAENIENLPTGYYEKLCRGKDAAWISVYVDGKDAESDVGAIFGRWVARASKAGLVGVNFEHPMDGCFTVWDLGFSDATAIWVWRLGPNGRVDLLDYYEASGEDISHFLEWVDSRPYKYLKHWLPHDSKAKNLQTGKSTLERIAEHWGSGILGVVPASHVDDSIGAARWLLEGRCRIHARCAKELPARASGLRLSGVRVLNGYKFAWDEVKKVFSKKPDHDWASHGADAFRYLATVVRLSEALSEPALPKTAKTRKPVTEPTTLDNLWRQEAAKRDSIRRI